MPNAPQRRVLVLFPGALGDFICFLPALCALAEDACIDPSTRAPALAGGSCSGFRPTGLPVGLHLLARSEFADLAPPSVSVASLERYEIRRLFVADARDDERVRNFFASYAAVYSWMGSEAREFVRQLESVSEGRAHIFPFRPRDRKTHQQDYYFACLDSPHGNPPLPAIAPRPQTVEWCDHFWREHSLAGRGVLTLAPGSGAAEKNWPIHFYRAIAEWWRRRTQGATVALSGPVEEERGGFDALSDCCTTVGNLNLGQVAALLARSDVYLGNDSGITHLAAAVGVRTVALFGPSDARQWAPSGRKVVILSRNVECSPCEVSLMKYCPHRKCLTSFYPADVITELEKQPEVATLTRGGAGITV